MKKILSKGLGIMAIFAMTFNVALATTVPQQITICHFPPGNPNSPQTITISASAWTTHSSHGDYEGICEGEVSIPACDVEANLVYNGGFEATAVAPGDWSLFPHGTAGLGWSVAWQNPVGAPAVANLEVHNSLWTPVVEGSQYAELDTDFGTPAGGPASVLISQTIATVNGNTYELGYDFSPRPGTDSSQNVLGIWVNGVQVDSQFADGTANGGNAWTPYTYSFTATGGSTTIAFSDNGTSDSLGTLLDNVSVRCSEEGLEQCEDMLYARIRTAERGWWDNWGTGNLGDWNDKGTANPPVYVGGNNLLHNTLGGDGYTSQEWFPLIDSETCLPIVDAEFDWNVPGVAVQRLNGSLRVVLYGSHPGANIQHLENREFAKGNIELSKDMVTKLTGAWDKANGWVDPANAYTRVHDPLVNDAANPMDARGSFNGNIHIHHPSYDNVSVWNDFFRFHLVATTGNDGFYAKYNN